MIPIIIAEKLVTVAVLVCAVVVSYMTIHHGDISLGLMVLLGQAQSLFSHHGHSATHEATHLAIHRNI